MSKEIRHSLEQLVEDLKNGVPLRATRVTMEQTPDGPLTTFEEGYVVDGLTFVKT